MYILKQTYTLNVVAVAAQLSTLGDGLYRRPKMGAILKIKTQISLILNNLKTYGKTWSVGDMQSIFSVALSVDLRFQV